MRLLAPIRLHNKLSQHSVLALVGLMAFAALMIIANPFGAHTSGADSVPTAVPPSSTVVSGQSTHQQGAGQGSLLTGIPSSTQTGDSDFGGSSGHHHDDGNSTEDS